MTPRPLTLGLATALAALLHCPTKCERALAATANAEWPEQSEVQVVPEFVSRGRLGQFLLAVDEATKARTLREAAEVLSAKFANEASKSATEEASEMIQTKRVTPDASEDVHPRLWPAALSIAAVLPVAATPPKPQRADERPRHTDKPDETERRSNRLYQKAPLDTARISRSAANHLWPERPTS